MCNPVDMQNDFSTERQTDIRAMDRWVSVYVSFYNATGAQWLTAHSMLKTRLMIEPETSTRQKFLPRDPRGRMCDYISISCKILI